MSNKNIFSMITIINFFICTMATLPIMAQESVINKPLSLQQCLAIALDKNPTIKAAQQGIQVAREEAGEVQALYYPYLEISAAYSYWQKRAFLPEGFARPGLAHLIGPTPDWSAGLRARYTLWDGGERQAKLRAALAAQGIVEEELDRIKQEIAFAVYQSFFNLASAMEFRSLAQQQLLRAKDHLRLARERMAAGAVPKADVLRAQVEVSNAKLNLVRAENSVRIFKGSLNTTMGLAVETPLEIDAHSMEMEIKEWKEIDLAQAFFQAEQLRPEIRAAKKKVQSSFFFVEEARSAYSPKLRAEAGYGFRDTTLLPQDEEFLIGASLDFPLFTGFARKHRLARSKAQLTKDEAEAAKIIHRVREEVWIAHSRLREAFEAVATTRMQVQDAQESLRLAKERYRVGAGTINDLLDAETALHRAETNLISSHWDYSLAQAAFERARGKLFSSLNIYNNSSR